MENNQYIPFGVNHSSDDRIVALIEAYGMEAYGIYIALLFELRKRCNYLCALQSLPALARRWAVAPDLLLNIVRGFGLFEFTVREVAETSAEVNDEPDRFFSPYLNELMNPLEQKRMQMSEAGKIRSATAERSINGRFTSTSQQVKKSKEEKSKSKEEEKKSRWELLLNEIFEEQSWLEMQAMHSGMGLEFMEQLAEIISFFKKHICTYGKEYTILSGADAKSYFSNFIRPGSPTRQSLDAHLLKRKHAERTTNPYRYELHNPHTGERSYCGGAIPAYAPPRPNDNAVWNDEQREWE